MLWGYDAVLTAAQNIPLAGVRGNNGISPNTATTTALDEARTKTKAYQDFINVLSQIIEKHGAEVLNEINSAN